MICREMNVGTHWATRTVTSNQFDVSIEAFEGLYSVHSTLDSTTTLVVKHFIALSHRYSSNISLFPLGCQFFSLYFDNKSPDFVCK